MAMEKNSIEEITTSISFITVFSMLQFPFEKINGNPVPTIIFKNLPSYFHVFVLGLNFAFCGGVVAISLRQIYPRIAGFCRFVSLLSFFVAFGVFAYLAVPWAIDAFFPQASLYAYD